MSNLVIYQCQWVIDKLFSYVRSKSATTVPLTLSSKEVNLSISEVYQPTAQGSHTEFINLVMYPSFQLAEMFQMRTVYKWIGGKTHSPRLDSSAYIHRQSDRQTGSDLNRRFIATENMRIFVWPEGETNRNGISDYEKQYTQYAPREITQVFAS